MEGMDDLKELLTKIEKLEERVSNLEFELTQKEDWEREQRERE